MRLKVLAEIYTMHSSAQLCNLNFLSKFAKSVTLLTNAVAVVSRDTANTQLAGRNSTVIRYAFRSHVTHLLCVSRFVVERFYQGKYEAYEESVQQVQ